MRNMKRTLSLVLVFMLFISSLASTVLADVVARPVAGGAIDDAYPQFPLTDGEALTWAQGAKRISSLLGFLPEDAADIDFESYAGQMGLTPTTTAFTWRYLCKTAI